MTRQIPKTDKLIRELRSSNLNEDLKGRLIVEIHRLQDALLKAYEIIDRNKNGESK